MPTDPAPGSWLTPSCLGELTDESARRFWADPQRLLAGLATGDGRRRIFRDDRLDVWLRITPPGVPVRLHDHGGSAGAFTVIEGELNEVVPAGWSDGLMSLRYVAHRRATTVTFVRHHIHDLVSADSTPAISVHAYSPPLRALRAYDVVDGELVDSDKVATTPSEGHHIARRAS